MSTITVKDGNGGDTMNEDSPSNAGLSRRDVLLGGAIATVTAVEGGRG